MRFMTRMLIATVLVVAASCGSDDAAAPTTEPSVVATYPPTTYPPTTDPPTKPPPPRWVERDVTVPFGADQLHGVLTLPAAEGPHPAVVLVTGSEDADGDRGGVSNREFIELSHRLAADGMAALRYDPPGTGQSSGSVGLPSLDQRAEETAAAVDVVRSSSSVAADSVGLLGVSQGGWVISMTAVRHPAEVAFLISVVGSGQTVAEQQLFGIEAQSRAAGLSDADVAKAVLFGRLLIDWQLTEPIGMETNMAEANELGPGPWAELMTLVYEPGDIDNVAALALGIEIMESVQDEPWAEALYLEELYIPQFESIPDDITPEQLLTIQESVAADLLLDPRDVLTQVDVPVLAFFGADDVNVDTETSAELYERYLSEAGNDDVTIVVIPDVGHHITTATPGYWDTMSDWLATRFVD